MSYDTQIWIVGSSGRIGSELVKILNPINYEILATDIEEVDITDSKRVNIYADMYRPDVIINCAGLTDLNYCEENLEEAFSVNAIGTKNLAIAANRINAKIIQLSTDDVFDGMGDKPYREYDKVGANTIYGKSKILAEEYIKEFSQNYFILRSSWLYGGGNKYVERIAARAKEYGLVEVAKNQIGSPTSSKELAKFILTIIDSYNYGTYHVACEGSCSRKEFAEEVLKIAGINAKVKEVEDLGKFSNRPEYSALDNFLIRISKMYNLPKWKVALEDYIKEVNI